MTDFRFILPSVQYRDSYVDAMREGLYLQEQPEEEIRLAQEDFQTYLEQRRDLNHVFTLPGGGKAKRVPSTEFWMVSGKDHFIGRVAIRHELSAHLEKLGGHIGYAVRKSERGKGHARRLLAHALKYARVLGLEKVLLTVNDDIDASIKVIEDAGGVLQDKIEVPGRTVPHRRYWISL